MFINRFSVSIVPVIGFFSGILLSSMAMATQNSDNQMLAKTGDIIQVRLDELHPTQVAVGKLQIAGDLDEYTTKPEKLFMDLCKVQGAGKLEQQTQSSSPEDPSSYRCSLPVGTDKSAMNTVDIGPGGKIYLTDGHHAFNSFWEASGGNVRLSVLVGENLSHDAKGNPVTQAQFEQKMAELKHFLPIDAKGNAITFAQLPSSLGLKLFQDDPWRSMLYYLRGISYDKSDNNLDPKTGKPYPEVPFLEFYWGQLLNNKMNLSQYSLSELDGYINALKDAAKIMTELSPEQLVGGSGKSAAELGKLDKIHKKKLKKLSEPDSKLARALAYQMSHQP
ncbi:ParB/Srx family N-terminal domain-containing protein [Budviciaceae bacterium CWB-B4]|uniref:ParB/Srx family N-terminal domain-containing protein n=1 Tax=Limnobaculum xujianqingii TaxID=2738837 RepID=A0A9D7ALT9_9GAMM|nr:ParB/Srx family N-terminal domain-containing protein [Limnobaculum xujianqingii]MBK5074978.1 ParB/Srx family N-terminal domain-containing protein [Limnobaculum xujianqingii]MBK5178288.1 ParB/Srx family N-terminal domain-containing protein [Limnobaculum xujianqingii]